MGVATVTFGCTLHAKVTFRLHASPQLVSHSEPLRIERCYRDPVTHVVLAVGYSILDLLLCCQ